MKKWGIIFIMVFSILFSCSKTQEDDVQKKLVNQEKKKIIIWGSTDCPHCVDAMPQFKGKIYDIFKEKVDIQVHVINWKKFDVDIPQNIDIKTIPRFETFTWKNCSYIPSFVVLDTNNKIILSSCGWEKDIDDILLIIP